MPSCYSCLEEIIFSSFCTYRNKDIDWAFEHENTRLKRQIEMENIIKIQWMLLSNDEKMMANRAVVGLQEIDPRGLAATNHRINLHGSNISRDYVVCNSHTRIHKLKTIHWTCLLKSRLQWRKIPINPSGWL